VEAALAAAAGDLDALGRRWALVGGLAVSARAEPRTTRDVDIAVDVEDDRDAESLIFALRGRGYAVEATVEHKSAARLATARLRSTAHSGVLLDLLFASCGVEREIARDASVLTLVPSVSVRVASIGHLLAMKLLARDDRSRPQDADDIRNLLREATDADVACARNAVRLVAQRGFARGRDLERLLDAALAEPSMTK
jgi:predicted nucleotidyltransferase